MPINDILTQIDRVPNLGDSRQAPSEPNQPGGSDSEYRRALSRSLNGDTGRDSAPTDTASSPDIPQNQAASERAADRQQAGVSNDGSSLEPRSQAAATTPGGGASDTAPASQDDANPSTDITEVVATDQQDQFPSHGAPAVITEIVLPTDGVPLGEFFSSGDGVLSPPPHVSLLFDTSLDAGDNLAEADTEDDGPLSPPAGLFESVVTSAVQNLNDLSAGLTPGPNVTEAADAGDSSASEATSDLPRSFAPAVDGSAGQQGELSTADQSQTPLYGVEVFEPNIASTGNFTVDNQAQAAPFGEPGNDVTAGLTAAVAEAAGAQTSEATAPDADLVTYGPPSDAAIGTETGKTASAVTGPASELSLSSPASSEAESSVSGLQRHGQDLQTIGSPAATRQDTNSSTPLQQAGSTASAPGVDPGEFVDRVANSIRLAQQEGQQLRVRLNPPHLGPLHIEVTSQGGTLTVQLEVQTASAHGALLENMSILREALAQHTTSLGQIDVQLVDPAQEDAPSGFSDDTGQQQSEGQSQQNSQEQTGEQEEEDDPGPNQAGIEELDIQI